MSWMAPLFSNNQFLQFSTKIKMSALMYLNAHCNWFQYVYIVKEKIICVLCVKMTRKIHIKQKTTSVFECLLIILIIIHLFDELDRIFDRFIAIALSIFTMFVQMFLCLILYISGWNPKYFWFGNLWFEFTRFLG